MFGKKKKEENLEVTKKKSTPKINLSKNEQMVLGAIGIGGILACSYFFVFEPMNAKIKPLKEEVKTLESTVASRRNIDEQLKQSKDLLLQKEKDYKQVVMKVPETDKYPEVSRELHNTAFYNNVKLTNVTFGKPAVVNTGEAAAPAAAPEGGAQPSEADLKNQQEYQDLRNAKNGFYKYTVTVNYEGSYMHVLNFIKAMEAKEHILELTNISLREEEKKEEVDNTKAKEAIQKEIVELDKDINDLVTRAQAEVDPEIKQGLQNDIVILQNQRKTLEDRLKGTEDKGKGKGYTVTGGTMTFDYYSKGDIKTEKHDFNVGNYGKEDLFK